MISDFLLKIFSQICSFQHRKRDIFRIFDHVATLLYTMPRLQGDFWKGYDIQLNSQGKQHYKCKICGKQWVKNASQLLSHYNDYALQAPSANITETPTPLPEQTFK